MQFSFRTLVNICERVMHQFYRTFTRKYLYRLRIVHITLPHHFIVFIPTFARSFIHLFANDEFAPYCSALMDGLCFRTFYRRLGLVGIVRIVTRVKTDRSIDPVLSNGIVSRFVIYNDPVFKSFRNDSQILRRLTRWDREMIN